MSELIDRERFSADMRDFQNRVGIWRDEAEDTETRTRADAALATIIETKLILDKQPTIAASPWHRVEDELPEPIHPTDPRYKAYLICDSLGYMHVADYTHSKHFPTCYSFHVNGEEETDVKYWMPIEPPKEDA